MTTAEIWAKGIKEDAVVENADIVFYDMLIQLVHKTNVEGESVSVLTQTLDEEKSMAEWNKVQYTSHAYSAMARYWSIYYEERNRWRKTSTSTIKW